MTDRPTLGAYLAQCRAQYGYSQEGLAILSGVHNSTISLIENGQTPSPSFFVVAKLCKHLGIDLEFLASHVDLTPRKGVRSWSDRPMKLSPEQREALESELRSGFFGLRYGQRGPKAKELRRKYQISQGTLYSFISRVKLLDSQGAAS